MLDLAVKLDRVAEIEVLDLRAHAVVDIHRADASRDDVDRAARGGTALEAAVDGHERLGADVRRRALQIRSVSCNGVHDLRALRTLAQHMSPADPVPDFEGNEWDEFCQQALSRKYGAAWQKIPAKNRGDWGLEGFVRAAGIVVQCYADDSVSNTDRTRKQKGKLTGDVPKLRKYSEPLKRVLDMTLHTYVLLVPAFEDKELLPHAQDKSEMVRGWQLPWIDPSFAITVNDFDFVKEEWDALRGSLRPVIDLAGATAEPPPVELVQTLISKLGVIPRLAVDPKRAGTWRDWLQTEYVEGNGLMLKLDEVSPQYHDRITRIVAGRERNLALRTDASEPLDDLRELVKSLADAIHRDVAAIDDADAQSIAGGVVAEWLMRCPLEYAA